MHDDDTRALISFVQSLFPPQFSTVHSTSTERVLALLQNVGYNAKLAQSYIVKPLLDRFLGKEEQQRVSRAQPVSATGTEPTPGAENPSSVYATQPDAPVLSHASAGVAFPAPDYVPSATLAESNEAKASGSIKAEQLEELLKHAPRVRERSLNQPVYVRQLPYAHWLRLPAVQTPKVWVSAKEQPSLPEQYRRAASKNEILEAMEHEESLAWTYHTTVMSHRATAEDMSLVSSQSTSSIDSDQKPSPRAVDDMSLDVYVSTRHEQEQRVEQEIQELYQRQINYNYMQMPAVVLNSMSRGLAPGASDRLPALLHWSRVAARSLNSKLTDEPQMTESRDTMKAGESSAIVPFGSPIPSLSPTSLIKQESGAPNLTLFSFPGLKFPGAPGRTEGHVGRGTSDKDKDKDKDKSRGDPESLYAFVNTAMGISSDATARAYNLTGPAMSTVKTTQAAAAAANQVATEDEASAPALPTPAPITMYRYDGTPISPEELAEAPLFKEQVAQETTDEHLSVGESESKLRSKLYTSIRMDSNSRVGFAHLTESVPLGEELDLSSLVAPEDLTEAFVAAKSQAREARGYVWRELVRQALGIEPISEDELKEAYDEELQAQKESGASVSETDEGFLPRVLIRAMCQHEQNRAIDISRLRTLTNAVVAGLQQGSAVEELELSKASGMVMDPQAIAQLQAAAAASTGITTPPSPLPGWIRAAVLTLLTERANGWHHAFRSLFRTRDGVMLSSLEELEQEHSWLIPYVTSKERRKLRELYTQGVEWCSNVREKVHAGFAAPSDSFYGLTEPYVSTPILTQSMSAKSANSSASAAADAVEESDASDDDDRSDDESHRSGRRRGDRFKTKSVSRDKDSDADQGALSDPRVPSRKMTPDQVTQLLREADRRLQGVFTIDAEFLRGALLLRKQILSHMMRLLPFVPRRLLLEIDPNAKIYSSRPIPPPKLIDPDLLAAAREPFVAPKGPLPMFTSLPSYKLLAAMIEADLIEIPPADDMETDPTSGKGTPLKQDDDDDDDDDNDTPLRRLRPRPSRGRGRQDSDDDDDDDDLRQLTEDMLNESDDLLGGFVVYIDDVPVDISGFTETDTPIDYKLHLEQAQELLAVARGRLGFMHIPQLSYLEVAIKVCEDWTAYAKALASRSPQKLSYQSQKALKQEFAEPTATDLRTDGNAQGDMYFVRNITKPEPIAPPLTDEEANGTAAQEYFAEVQDHIDLGALLPLQVPELAGLSRFLAANLWVRKIQMMERQMLAKGLSGLSLEDAEQALKEANEIGIPTTNRTYARLYSATKLALKCEHQAQTHLTSTRRRNLEFWRRLQLTIRLLPVRVPRANRVQHVVDKTWAWFRDVQTALAAPTKERVLASLWLIHRAERGDTALSTLLKQHRILHLPGANDEYATRETEDAVSSAITAQLPSNPSQWTLAMMQFLNALELLASPKSQESLTSTTCSTNSSSPNDSYAPIFAPVALDLVTPSLIDPAAKFARDTAVPGYPLGWYGLALPQEALPEDAFSPVPESVPTHHIPLSAIEKLHARASHRLLAQLPPTSPELLLVTSLRTAGLEWSQAVVAALRGFTLSSLVAGHLLRASATALEKARTERAEAVSALREALWLYEGYTSKSARGGRIPGRAEDLEMRVEADGDPSTDDADENESEEVENDAEDGDAMTDASKPRSVPPRRVGSRRGRRGGRVTSSSSGASRTAKADGTSDRTEKSARKVKRGGAGTSSLGAGQNGEGDSTQTSSSGSSGSSVSTTISSAQALSNIARRNALSVLHIPLVQVVRARLSDVDAALALGWCVLRGETKVPRVTVSQLQQVVLYMKRCGFSEGTDYAPQEPLYTLTRRLAVATLWQARARAAIKWGLSLCEKHHLLDHSTAAKTSNEPETQSSSSSSNDNNDEVEDEEEPDVERRVVSALRDFLEGPGAPLTSAISMALTAAATTASQPGMGFSPTSGATRLLNALKMTGLVPALPQQLQVQFEYLRRQVMQQKQPQSCPSHVTEISSDFIERRSAVLLEGLGQGGADSNWSLLSDPAVEAAEAEGMGLGMTLGLTADPSVYESLAAQQASTPSLQAFAELESALVSLIGASTLSSLKSPATLATLIPGNTNDASSGADGNPEAVSEANTTGEEAENEKGDARARSSIAGAPVPIPSSIFAAAAAVATQAAASTAHLAQTDQSVALMDLGGSLGSLGAGVGTVVAVQSTSGRRGARSSAAAGGRGGRRRGAAAAAADKAQEDEQSATTTSDGLNDIGQPGAGTSGLNAAIGAHVDFEQAAADSRDPRACALTSLLFDLADHPSVKQAALNESVSEFQYAEVAVLSSVNELRENRRLASLGQSDSASSLSQYHPAVVALADTIGSAADFGEQARLLVQAAAERASSVTKKVIDKVTSCILNSAKIHEVLDEDSAPLAPLISESLKASPLKVVDLEGVSLVPVTAGAALRGLRTMYLSAITTLPLVGQDVNGASCELQLSTSFQQQLVQQLVTSATELSPQNPPIYDEIIGTHVTQEEIMRLGFSTATLAGDILGGVHGTGLRFKRGTAGKQRSSLIPSAGPASSPVAPTASTTSSLFSLSGLQPSGSVSRGGGRGRSARGSNRGSGTGEDDEDGGEFDNPEGDEREADEDETSSDDDGQGMGLNKDEALETEESLSARGECRLSSLYASSSESSKWLQAALEDLADTQEEANARQYLAQLVQTLVPSTRTLSQTSGTGSNESGADYKWKSETPLASALQLVDFEEIPQLMKIAGIIRSWRSALVKALCEKQEVVSAHESSDATQAADQQGEATMSIATVPMKMAPSLSQGTRKDTIKQLLNRTQFIPVRLPEVPWIESQFWSKLWVVRAREALMDPHTSATRLVVLLNQARQRCKDARQRVAIAGSIEPRDVHIAQAHLSSRAYLARIYYHIATLEPSTCEPFNKLRELLVQLAALGGARASNPSGMFTISTERDQEVVSNALTALVAVLARRPGLVSAKVLIDVALAMGNDLTIPWSTEVEEEAEQPPAEPDAWPPRLPPNEITSDVRLRSLLALAAALPPVPSHVFISTGLYGQEIPTDFSGQPVPTLASLGLPPSVLAEISAKRQMFLEVWGPITWLDDPLDPSDFASVHRYLCHRLEQNIIFAAEWSRLIRTVVAKHLSRANADVVLGAPTTWFVEADPRRPALAVDWTQAVAKFAPLLKLRELDPLDPTTISEARATYAASQTPLLYFHHSGKVWQTSTCPLPQALTYAIAHVSVTNVDLAQAEAAAAASASATASALSAMGVATAGGAAANPEAAGDEEGTSGASSSVVPLTPTGRPRRAGRGQSLAAAAASTSARKRAAAQTLATAMMPQLRETLATAVVDAIRAKLVAPAAAGSHIQIAAPTQVPLEYAIASAMGYYVPASALSASVAAACHAKQDCAGAAPGDATGTGDVTSQSGSAAATVQSALALTNGIISPNPLQQPPQRLYCFCRLIIEDGDSMVACDGCGDWFHLSCLGISRFDVKKIKKFQCPSCAAARLVPYRFRTKLPRRSRRWGPSLGVLEELATIPEPYSGIFPEPTETARLRALVSRANMWRRRALLALNAKLDARLPGEPTIETMRARAERYEQEAADADGDDDDEGGSRLSLELAEQEMREAAAAAEAAAATAASSVQSSEAISNDQVPEEAGQDSGNPTEAQGGDADAMVDARVKSESAADVASSPTQYAAISPRPEGSADVTSSSFQGARVSAQVQNDQSSATPLPGVSALNLQRRIRSETLQWLQREAQSIPAHMQERKLVEERIRLLLCMEKAESVLTANARALADSNYLSNARWSVKEMLAVQTELERLAATENSVFERSDVERVWIPFNEFVSQVQAWVSQAKAVLEEPAHVSKLLETQAECRRRFPCLTTQTAVDLARRIAAVHRWMPIESEGLRSRKPISALVKIFSDRARDCKKTYSDLTLRLESEVGKAEAWNSRLQMLIEHRAGPASFKELVNEAHKVPRLWLDAKDIRLAEEKSKCYCLCQKPAVDGVFMLGCEKCDDWFHPECVGTTIDVASVFEDPYICPRCCAALGQPHVWPLAPSYVPFPPLETPIHSIKASKTFEQILGGPTLPTYQQQQALQAAAAAAAAADAVLSGASPLGGEAEMGDFDAVVSGRTKKRMSTKMANIQAADAGAVSSSSSSASSTTADGASACSSPPHQLLTLSNTKVVEPPPEPMVPLLDNASQPMTDIDGGIIMIPVSLSRAAGLPISNVYYPSNSLAQQQAPPHQQTRMDSTMAMAAAAANATGMDAPTMGLRPTEDKRRRPRAASERVTASLALTAPSGRGRKKSNPAAVGAEMGVTSPQVPSGRQSSRAQAASAAAAAAASVVPAREDGGEANPSLAELVSMGAPPSEIRNAIARALDDHLAMLTEELAHMPASETPQLQMGAVFDVLSLAADPELMSVLRLDKEDPSTRVEILASKLTALDPDTMTAVAQAYQPQMMRAANVIQAIVLGEQVPTALANTSPTRVKRGRGRRSRAEMQLQAQQAHLFGAPADVVQQLNQVEAVLDATGSLESQVPQLVETINPQEVGSMSAEGDDFASDEAVINGSLDYVEAEAEAEVEAVPDVMGLTETSVAEPVASTAEAVEEADAGIVEETTHVPSEEPVEAMQEEQDPIRDQRSVTAEVMVLENSGNQEVGREVSQALASPVFSPTVDQDQNLASAPELGIKRTRDEALEPATASELVQANESTVASYTFMEPSPDEKTLAQLQEDTATTSAAEPCVGQEETQQVGISSSILPSKCLETQTESPKRVRQDPSLDDQSESTQ